MKLPIEILSGELTYERKCTDHNALINFMCCGLTDDLELSIIIGSSVGVPLHISKL